MGAGKTTLASALAHSLAGKQLLEESGKHPFIKEFYIDQDAFALETEICFVLLHYHQILRASRAGVFAQTVVSDFALERDYVFAKLTLKRSDDWRLFEQVYQGLKARLPKADLLLYLRAPVDFLIRRIAQRGREYEKLMARDYLQAVNTALDNFFLNEFEGQIVVLDAPNLDASVNPKYVESVLSRIL